MVGATHALADIEACDVLLVPGSATETATLMADREVLDWIREIHRTTRLTVSVCSGALILGAAGLLDGLPATTHWLGLPVLEALGARPMPQDRIVDCGRLITAAGVSAGIDLALHVVGRLCGDDEARIAQLMIEYDPHPPYDSGHLSMADPAVARRARARMARIAALNPRNLVSVPKIVGAQWRKALARARRSRS